MNIPFTKMSGSGNDFIIIDNRDSFLSVLDISEVARHLCRRRISIGADGMILIADSSLADICMKYFNSDGSEPGMCGNGVRCTAFVANMLGLPAKISLETGAGIISAEIRQNRVQVQMPQGRLVETNIELVIDGLPMLFDLYDTGVPHAVTIVDDITSIPVKHWGKEIRYHRHFNHMGANVDFAEIIDTHTIRLRTYERGVENETFACGTGAVAAAISAHRKMLVQPPVYIITKSNDTLTVKFPENSKEFIDNPLLEGDVVLSFFGKVEIDAKSFSIGAKT